ncbi:MAG: putative Enoyl-CoA hydratase [Nitrospira sp.]|jgi:methylglutaconyl-CoA hydratase|nr:putative Enoyl-CoA hydratase [Nitrospira sp.]
MNRFTTVAVESDGSIARVTLNRPERRNAFDDRMVTELSDAFETLAQDQSLRGIVLAGTGPVFCAGADLQGMQSSSPVSEAQAKTDALRLTRMFRAIDECPCPVMALVQGPAFGGGVGLMAVCDIVVAAEDATFSLSEARLGLIPAVIAPFLLRKAGESFLRRYCLTGEAFSASIAHCFGLVHDVVPRSDLDDRITELIEAIMRLAPRATRESKTLLHTILPLSEGDRLNACAEANARARCAAEATEGLRAFVEKRLPSWAKPCEPKPDQEALEQQDVAEQRT